MRRIVGTLVGPLFGADRSSSRADTTVGLGRPWLVGPDRPGRAEPRFAPITVGSVAWSCAACGSEVSPWAARCGRCGHGTDDAVEVVDDPLGFDPPEIGASRFDGPVGPPAGWTGSVGTGSVGTGADASGADDPGDGWGDVAESAEPVDRRVGRSAPPPIGAPGSRRGSIRMGRPAPAAPGPRLRGRRHLRGRDRRRAGGHGGFPARRWIAGLPGTIVAAGPGGTTVTAAPAGRAGPSGGRRPGRRRAQGRGRGRGRRAHRIAGRPHPAAHRAGRDGLARPDLVGRRGPRRAGPAGRRPGPRPVHRRRPAPGRAVRRW